ncbi:MAG: sigma-54 dependent transcriptional regulator [Deltaproteobacteria bacterium]|nr:sigma-54 dependent transcriptional regulator [Deltaproteobacteria bacterium]NND30023.1 sigma-54-dependent Fis family transcriptional regulator [Myxococcales bacterium]MBT8466393.1 sigma-54 dependent transcriptional regulator [Deltaproteobacteria bacterium]MBT8480845.1 sigma-54 dependent transcriptional regulator [Deltaproteobacteria bacterium]NNK08134.1 sigma-54-dependent Fis family transcriptional regulator [Myxococcales bacterium]
MKSVITASDLSESAEQAKVATSKGRVLIVDDEANARSALAELLDDAGYSVSTAADGRTALLQIEQMDPDVVLTDLKMPGMDGLSLIERGRPMSPHTTFIVMTAFATIDTAVKAIKLGAESYLTKPLELDAVMAIVDRALDRTRLSREAAHLRERFDDRFQLGNILGEHPSMQRLMKNIAQVARSRATVLIHGETGTGKELIAAAIHQNSKRKDKPFIKLNCASLSETLLESELFGHERGSFTGAMTRREGRFKQADGGTLFLDEVSEIPASVQIKLLRFLQEREFERVGGNETLKVDVRVVAATNRNLKQRVDEGKFREDLYYRLKVVQLDVPPLRVRRSDIPLLAHAFLRKYAGENDQPVQGLSDEALQHLMIYPWPGNVRELENAIERAVVMCENELIERDDLPTSAHGDLQNGSVMALIPGITMSELERVAILRTLDAVDGSTARAAEILGISQRKIQYRVKEWGYQTPLLD